MSRRPTKEHYRTKALRHYPNRCDRCGAPPPQTRSLDIHHRDLDHANDDIANLQVLCRSCHRRTHLELGVAEQVWQKRRAKGGPGNEPPVRADGSLRPDCYRDDPATGCRIWTGHTSNGVPNYANPARRGGWRSVRRELWRLHRGEPIPDHVGVSCENSLCVALDHLQDGITFHGIAPELRDAITSVAPMLSAGTIARRLGVSREAVTNQISRSNAPRTSAFHAATQRFALEGPPARPAGVSDRHWTIFLASLGRTFQETGDQFGITRQRVDQIVKRVMSAIGA